MHEQIRSWVEDVIRANVYEHLQQKLQKLKTHPYQDIFDDIDDVTKKVESSRGNSTANEDSEHYQYLLNWIDELEGEEEGEEVWDEDEGEWVKKEKEKKKDEDTFSGMRPQKFKDLNADDRDKELTNLLEWFKRKKKTGMKRALEVRGQEIRDTKKSLAKIKRPENAKAGFQTREFEIDLDGWGYFNKAFKSRARKKLNKQVDKALAKEHKDGKLSPAELKKRKAELQKELVEDALDNLPKVTVSLIDPARAKNQGAWSDEKNTLYLPIDRMPAKDWRRTLSHELRHMGQSLMQRALGIPHRAPAEGGRKKTPAGPGLPSRRMMDPEIQQQYGHLGDTPAEAQRLVKRLKEQGITQTKFHSLDDMEFYTLLADAVETFKDEQKKKKWDARDTQTALRLYSGTLETPKKNADWDKIDPNRKIRHSEMRKANDALQTWKDHNSEKWKKATKELVKAVQSSASSSDKKSVQGLWKQFLEEKYEGGKAKVVNPNSKTRDSHPEITVSYLMAQSDPAYGSARQRVRREFVTWQQPQR